MRKVTHLRNRCLHYVTKQNVLKETVICEIKQVSLLSGETGEIALT